MKKQKKSKMIILLVLVVAIISCLVYINSNKHKKPVYVYSFYDGIVGLSDYVEGANENSGFITSDKVQTVILTSTQTSINVLVENGQEVSKGDVLYTYDTTLSDIALNQKAIEIEEMKLNLETAKNELKKINALNPAEPPKPPFDPTTTLVNWDLTGKEYLPYYGDGDTALTPMYVWLRSDGILDQKFLENSFDWLEANYLFLKVHHTENDLNDGVVTDEYGVKIIRKIDEETKETRLGYTFYNLENEEIVDPEKVYTKEEIALMKKEKQKEINDCEFNIKIAQAEYNIMLKEADSGTVEAEYDGVITNLVSIAEAQEKNVPLMKVSGGGGYYISSQINELDLDKIQIGQAVTVNSWQTGSVYEGKVVEISKFPDTNNYYDTGRNESYYPFKVLVSGEANFRDNDYVSLMLDNSAQEAGLYIDNAFLRKDGASAYVYVRGEDGKLEKRKIKVGKSLWGSYTQVLSGITSDDYLAFPYGKEVKEGAATVEGTYDDLYGGGMMYGEY